MAETEFFAVEEEIIDVVKWLLEQRCVFIADLHYDSRLIPRLTEVSRIQLVAFSTPHFFVAREDLLESPLSVREVTTVEKHFFYIYPRTGGPTLQFFWGRRTDKDGKDHLSASWLSYYTWYEDSVTHQRKKISGGVLDIYSAAAKMIRATRRKIQPGKREFWISPTVEELVHRGTTLVGFEGKSPNEVLRNPR